jgi:hypothetical protein
MSKPFSVIAALPSTNPLGQTIHPVSRERHPFTQINPEDVTEGEKVQPEDLRRIVKQVQENVDAATTPYRTNPLLTGELHQSLPATSGKNLVIKHGLGVPWAYYVCRRSRPLNKTTPSAPFAAAELPGNLGLDVRQYLVLAMSSTGIYDIEINPG